MSETNWLSVHIYYSSNQNPVLVDCVGPLVERLRRQALVRRYFFVRYWLEGPHVRLRLLPAKGVSSQKLKAGVEPWIEAFLKERPALYELEHDTYADYHKRNFILEYGEEEWNKRYGKDGTMPIRPNNTLAYVEYEPEFDRYGGMHGLELAEWHFERSSDLVLGVLREVNVHAREILLGASTQLSLLTCFGCLGSVGEVINFLQNYIGFWTERYYPMDDERHRGFRKRYEEMKPMLQTRITEVQRHVSDSHGGTITAREREWLTHIRQVRNRIDVLCEQGRLVFGAMPGTFMPGATLEDRSNCYQVLLSQYIHMMNNRFGVSIPDEVYLSSILRMALSEREDLRWGSDRPQEQV
jgi:thiopeptide-type bacteriocin biosynthesis protein